MICRMFGALELSAMKEEVDFLFSESVMDSLNLIYQRVYELFTGFRDMKMYIPLFYICIYVYMYIHK